MTLHYGPAYIEQHHAAIVAAAPGLAEEIASQIGLVPTLKLLNALGGVRVYFNRDRRPPAGPVYEATARAIGTAAAHWLYELMRGCGHTELPLCSGVERLLRGRGGGEHEKQRQGDGGEDLVGVHSTLMGRCVRGGTALDVA